jgi:hypothetical protein
LAVGEQYREIAGQSLINPLIAIAGPSDDVAPPLMGDFMKRNQIVKVFLTARGKAGELLSGCRKKRVGREIEQARPTLAKAAGNLGDTQLPGRKRTGIRLVKTNRRIDVSRKLLQGSSRARRRQRRQTDARGRPGRAERARHLGDRVHGVHTQLFREHLLELAIGVDVDRIVGRGD